jgi:hypothetical protein
MPRRFKTREGGAYYRLLYALSRYAFVLMLSGFAADHALAQNDLAVATEYSGFDARTRPGTTPPPPVSSGGSITQTRTQRLTIVAQNLGTTSVASAYVELFVGSDASARLTASTGPECALSVAGPPLNGARWNLPALAAGETRQCILTLRALPIPPGTSGIIRARIGSTSNIDPVPTNDSGPPYDVYVSPVDYIRDMALSIRSPAGILRPGIPYSVDFTLTNFGPGLEGDPNFTQDIYSQTYLVGPGSGEFFAFAYDGDPDCRYLVEDVGSGTFARTSIITFGPLAPGQSRTCTLLLAVLPGATGTRRLPFWNYAELPGVFDERLENNIADLTLQYSAPAIPAGSPWAWLVLALALGSVGLVQARRQLAARPGDRSG